MSKITLKNGTTEILNTEALDNFMNNFRAQIEGTETNIADLEAQITTERNNRRNLIEQSMLTPSDTYKDDIVESENKIANYSQILETEKERLAEYKTILQNNETFAGLLADFSSSIPTDVNTYMQEDEKALYEEMATLRNRYEEIFAELNSKRNEIQNTVFVFNGLCEKFGQQQYKKTVGFHTHLQMVNPSFPDCGIIYPNLPVPLQNVTERFVYARRGIQRYL